MNEPRWPAEWHGTIVDYLRDIAEALRDRKKLGEPSGFLKQIAVDRIDGPTIEVRYKRERGRQPGTRSPWRFLADPNKVAAAIARDCVDDWRETSPSRGLHDAAAEHAVELINEYYVPLLRRYGKAEACRAEIEKVKELLRQGRARWPEFTERI